MSLTAGKQLLLSSPAGGYQVSRSLRFNSADSTSLTRTFTSAGNRKTWTWSGWVKRSALGGDQHLFTAYVAGNDNQILEFRISSDQLVVAVWTTQLRVTTQVFRDPGAWAHVVLAVDTTQATANDRIKLYWNGTQITQFGLINNPAQNDDLGVNQAGLHSIGREWTGASTFNGYLADIWFLDGIAATPSDFAETDATTGQWIPKTYSGSKGSNGFHLEFADNSNNTATTLGKDTSGNGNNWTPNNLSVTAGAGNDSLVDTPTSYGTGNSGGDVRGNFCTWNPLSRAGGATYSQGNLEYVGTLGGVDTPRTNATISVSTGKWYYEVTLLTAPGSPRNSGSVNNSFGWGLPSVFNKNSAPNTSAMDDAVFMGDSGWYKNFTGSNTDSGYGFASGDVLGVAVDLDANTFAFYKNGTSIVTGTIGGTAGRELTPTCASYSGTYGAMAANFGQRPFAYPVSGYKALCDTNLTAPVIAKPNTLMDAKLYTGNGSTNNITGLNFSPDFVWIKRRDSAGNHALFDAVRGTGKFLESSTTGSETTSANSLTAFNSDGFSLGTETQTNTNSATYVAWTWDANSSNTTNTAGSITSTVRANATAGFSIVSYTGTGTSPVSVGHGLNVAPTFLIFKDRDTAVNWQVWTTAVNSSGTVLEGLNTTAAGTTPWTYISTTSSLIQFNSGNSAQTSNGKKFICYAWAPVTGYSSFGSYTGNGSADGPFVYTGFRPRWILMKQSVAGEAWTMYDTARDTYNVAGLTLFANYSNAETDYKSYTPLDILSNGFKLRTSNITWNTNGATVIYAAFAESPFQYARAR